MAGLLKQPRGPQPGQMSPGAMPPEQAPPESPEQMPPEQPEADESDPNFQAAIKLAMQALYEKGAADNVSAVIKQSPDIVEALSSTAYEMTSVVDEKTQGAVPDELLVLLASRILEEVADIAVASGAEVTPKIVAGAFKVMILRYMGDQGHDTRELQAAMDALPEEDFETLLNSDIGGATAQPGQPAPTGAPMEGA